MMALQRYCEGLSGFQGKGLSEGFEPFAGGFGVFVCYQGAGGVSCLKTN